MEYYDDNENENRDENESGINHDSYGSDQPVLNMNGKPGRQPNRMALISMICGIIGMLALCGCVTFPVSIIMGVAAITLAIMSKKGHPFSGFAIAGLVVGILSLIFGLIACVYIIALNIMMQDPNMVSMFEQMMEQYNSGTAQ